MIDCNSGVYQIVNTINNKRYIGSSSNLKYRKYKHFYTLKNKQHSSNHLQLSYNKYGKENFKFQILLYCNKENLIFYEQRALNLYQLNELYNKRTLAKSNLGFHHSMETKNKLKKIFTGRKFTEEHKIKISKSLKNKKKSKEHIEKALETKRKNGFKGARKGVQISEETKKKISNKLKLYVFTEEHKANISKGQIKKGQNELQKQGLIKARELNKRKIIAFDLNTKKCVGEFPSIQECAAFLKINKSHIPDAASGKRKKVGNYYFKYKD